MGKIKGWNNYLTIKNRVRYITDKPNKRNHKVAINIEKYYEATGKGTYWIMDVNEIGNKTLIHKKFKTKQQALDYAIKYMRSNPNG